MATFIKTDFKFNGEESTSYNLKLIKVAEGGLIGTPIIGGRDISEDYVPYRDEPFFYKTKMNPISMKMGFTIIDANSWTDSIKQSVFKWLYSPRTYCDFASYDNYDSNISNFSKIYKLIFTSPMDFMTTDLTNGYIELEARAYPTAYTPISSTPFSISSTPTTITMNNPTNVRNWDNSLYYYPKIYIDMPSSATPTDGKFKLINTSDNNRVFELTSLSSSEQVYIDNKLKIINTNIPDTNRINNLSNKQWFRLVSGTNLIQVYGLGTITFECQFPIMT